MTGAPALEPAPALPFASTLRFLKEMRADALSFVNNWAELGGVARFESRLLTSLLLTDPEAVQHVLQDNHKNYLKEVRSARIFRTALGNGLFLSEGDIWRTQQQTVRPAFHRRHLTDATVSMVEAIDEMLTRWSQFAERREEFSLRDEAGRLTVDIAGRTLFGQELGEDAKVLARANATIFEYFTHRLRNLIVVPQFIPTARNRAVRKALDDTYRIVDEILERGRAAAHSSTGLLSILLEAHDPADAVQVQELRDNVTTLLAASSETSGMALSWTWYLLAKHPHVARKLSEEIRSVLSHRRPGFDELHELTYTRMVIDEALRLYPPAWVIARTAQTDDQVCGFRIPAGASVYASAWVTHRSSRYWEDPEKFDPERFSPAHRLGRHTYAYYPFGGGPRTCIGDQFSLLAQTLALAMSMQRFRLRIDAEVVPEGLFTLRPRGRMPARVFPNLDL